MSDQDMMNPSEAAVLLELSESQLIADTSRLIAAAGENPGGTEEETVRVIRKLCAPFASRIEEFPVAPGRNNVLIGIGPHDGPTTLFLGHSDVVPVGEGWASAPFDPVLEHGRLYGRGASDMKGGIAAVIAAMRAIASHRADVSIDLLVTVDEEADGIGVAQVMRDGLVRPYQLCVVAEPTELRLTNRCRGVLIIELEVLGRAGHAGNPELGVSAIQAAAGISEFITRLQYAAKREPGGDLRETWSIGKISGGTAGSVIPERATLLIDRRLRAGERSDEVIATLLQDIAGLGLHPEIKVHATMVSELPGFDTPEDAAATRLLRGVLDDLGLPSESYQWTAACEGGVTHEHFAVPTLLFGPGSIDQEAHRANESVSVAELLLAAKSNALLALRVAEQGN